MTLSVTQPFKLSCVTSQIRSGLLYSPGVPILCLMEQLSSHLPRARYFIIYAYYLFQKARVRIYLNSQGTDCSCSPWQAQPVSSLLSPLLRSCHLVRGTHRPP